MNQGMTFISASSVRKGGWNELDWMQQLKQQKQMRELRVGEIAGCSLSSHYKYFLLHNFLFSFE